MILIAVIVGYILGVSPFVVPKIFEYIQTMKVENVQVTDNKMQEDILDEWLNGPRINEPIQKSQEEIYEEYITGIDKKGE